MKFMNRIFYEKSSIFQKLRDVLKNRTVYFDFLVLHLIQLKKCIILLLCMLKENSNYDIEKLIKTEALRILSVLLISRRLHCYDIFVLVSCNLCNDKTDMVV